MIFAVETKRDTVGLKGLTLQDKIKLTLMDCYSGVPMDEIVESSGGCPSFLGTSAWITERILIDYPEVLIDKMAKDALKSKPRFNNDISLCEAQIKGEVQSAFSGKDKTLWIVNEDLYYEDVSRRIYCHAPAGTEYYFDNTLDYFMDGMSLEDKGYTPVEIIEYEREEIEFSNNLNQRVTDAALAQLKAMPQEHTIDGYVYTLSHKEQV